MDEDHDLRETVVSSEVVRRGRYLTFRIDTIERADGTRATREICGHPGAVAILAVDDEDRVLMVRQWRTAAGRAMLEIPAGTLDVDPATGSTEDPALAARRELEEETGYRADRWQLLTSFWTAPGFATELMHLYLATGLRPAHTDRLGPDEDERLELVRMPRQDAMAATGVAAGVATGVAAGVATGVAAGLGEIVDAKSILGLLWLERLMTEAGT
jgi:ADP-ribose pyrophosphatase